MFINDFSLTGSYCKDFPENTTKIPCFTSSLNFKLLYNLATENVFLMATTFWCLLVFCLFFLRF